MPANTTLSEEIAIQSLRDFFREKPFLFFGSGVSCALNVQFGMPALKEALLTKMCQKQLTDQERAQWSDVESSLSRGIDLETALDRVSDQDLIKQITDITGSFIAELDRVFAFRIAEGSCEWPAARLVKRLVDTLPEGDRILHVLTPNYDMLFEYASDYTNIPYANGFHGGVEKRIDWDAVNQALLLPMKVLRGRKLRITYKHRKHVRLYKVHGSLNYFFHRGTVIENDAWMWTPPNFAQRVMITPGVSKYETLQRFRRELLQRADSAIERANQFLFIGYGFNDSHLEQYIRRKLINQGCRGLIITRSCNARITSLLEASPNLWLVCSADGGTRICNMQYPGSLVLPQRKLWDIGEFTTQILGG